MNAPDEPRFFPEPEQSGQDLLAELEESMPQGIPNDTGHRRRASDPAVDNDFADLDELLLQSVDAVMAEQQYKKDRELKKRGYTGLSKEEVDFCNSRMHAFEMARQWDPVKAVAVFAQYTCAECDSARTVFSRLMEFHQHRFTKTSNRWLTVETTKLENIQTVLEDRQVPMCMDCMTQFGLPEVTEDTPWFEDVVGAPQKENDDE